MVLGWAMLYWGVEDDEGHLQIPIVKRSEGEQKEYAKGVEDLVNPVIFRAQAEVAKIKYRESGLVVGKKIDVRVEIKSGDVEEGDDPLLKKYARLVEIATGEYVDEESGAKSEGWLTRDEIYNGAQEYAVFSEAAEASQKMEEQMIKEAENVLVAIGTEVRKLPQELDERSIGALKSLRTSLGVVAEILKQRWEQVAKRVGLSEKHIEWMQSIGKVRVAMAA